MSEAVTRDDWDVSLDALIRGINEWSDEGAEPHKVESAMRVLHWIIDNKVNVGKVAK